MNQITTVVMITHLEPDILECEVKWTLGSITMNKASGGDGIPVELFQILKDSVMETYKMGVTNELTGGISANKMVKKTGKEIKSRAEEQLCIERIEEHVTDKMTFRLRSE